VKFTFALILGFEFALSLAMREPADENLNAPIHRLRGPLTERILDAHWLSCFICSFLLVWLGIVTLLVVSSASAQNTVLWSSAGNSAWFTISNWTGSAVPGTTDIAQFGVNPTSVTTGIGINMNSAATNNGTNNQAVGALEILGSRSGNLLFGNSSTSVGGTLTLNGASLRGVSNVVIRHAGQGLITIQNTQGTGNRTMAVALGNATNNVVFIDGDGSVTISSTITGPERNLTLLSQGVGVLTLAGANTFSGTTTIRGGTLRLAYAGDNSSLSDTAALVIDHGVVDLAGSVAHTEVLGGLILNGGARITRSTGSATLQLGEITRGGSGTLDVGLPGIATTSSLNNGAGLIGAWATVGGSDFAANSTNAPNGPITAYSGYSNLERQGGVLSPAPTGNLQIINGGSSGTVTLNEAGVTEINTLKMGATEGSATVTFGSGQSLRLGLNGGLLAANGAQGLTIGSSPGNGGLTAGGAVDTASDLFLTSYGSGGLLVNSAITNNGTGAVRVIVSGTGVTTLATNNLFTGGLVINSGILSVDGPGRLGPATSGSVTFAGSSTLRMTSWAASSASGRTFSILEGVSATFETVVADNTLYTLSGAISGAGRLVKVGPGTLTLGSASNGYTGGTVVTQGRLSISADSRLGGIPLVATPGHLTLNGGTLLATASFTLNANRGIAVGAPSTVGSGTIEVASGSTLTYNGVVANAGSAAGTLVKTGAGTLVLGPSVNNTYSGGTTVSAGTLEFGRTGSLGSGDITLGSVGGGDASLLNYLGGWTLSNNVIVASGSGGTLTLGYTSTASFSGIFAGNITLNDHLTLRSDASDGFAMRITGSISGGFNLTKTGAGMVRIENNNPDYIGTTTISSGTVQLGSFAGSANGSLGNGDVINHGTLRLNRTNALALSNLISGSGVVTQTGTGTTTLSNANTYSGGTTVSAGTLLATNLTGSATGTGAVTTTVNTVLGGTGILAPTGSNGFSFGGVVSPGLAGAIGTLTVAPENGDAVFLGTSSLLFQLGGDGHNDRLVFAPTGTGSMDFSALNPGTIKVSFLGGYTPALGHRFDLIDWSALGINGLSPALLDFSEAVLPDLAWEWDTSDFVSSGVISVALIPEPGRMMLCLVGALMGLLRRRRSV
jgi:autotransporter-associated beta strand protein